jgi:hypothetical protein
MEQWEPCCNVTIFEEDFRGERFKDFPHSLETTIYYHSRNLKQSKRYMLLILKLELISLKPILSNHHRNGRLPLEDIVYELNYGKIAREVADEFTAKIQTNQICCGFNRTNKQNGKYVTRCK